MENPKEELKTLIKKGQSFNYNNFSEKSEDGNISVIFPEWITWVAHAKGVISNLCGNDSPAMETFKCGEALELVGRGEQRFKRVRSYYLGALGVVVHALNQDSFGELPSREQAMAPSVYSNEVFIVHGHDENAKNELESILTSLGLKPIVLHKEPDEGKTIIEKFEKYSNVGYAFILLTPDEWAYLASDHDKPDDKRQKEKRARPNVIFEFGYFVGKLGRSKVCCLHTGGVTLPSDVSGMLYKRFKQSIEEAGYGIIKELKAQGYKLK